MMRSLFSGVSGLVSHQVAMDVEGNNIANVNTVGFKYSRTNFQDSLLQTMKPSTAPQGQLGGRNALQIGSGTSVANVQRIHLQGATQATDKNTDMAINGNGYFVVSDDGGKTYYYTRAGNFTFDANGNLVNPNGLIAQGWLADKKFDVDSSMGIKNITIDPGMTVPAQKTSYARVSANLNAGLTVGTNERSPATSTVNLDSDIGALYSYDGRPIGLKRNNDILSLELTRRFDVAGVMTESSSVHVLTYGEGKTKSDGYFTTVQDLLDEINTRIKDSTGVYDNKVVLTGDGKIAGAQHITAIVAGTNTILNDILEPITYGVFQSRTFKADVNSYIGADDLGETFNAQGEAFMLKDGQGVAVHISNLGETRKFVYRAPSEDNENSYLYNNFQDSLDATKADKEEGLHWTLNQSGAKASLNQGDTISLAFNVITLPDGSTVNVPPLTVTYGKAGSGGFQTIEDLIGQINTQLSNSSASVAQLTWDADNGVIVDQYGAIGTANVALLGGGAPAANTPQANLQAILGSLGGAAGVATTSGAFKKNDTYYFTNMQELMNLYQDALEDAGDVLNFEKIHSATVSIDELGQISIKNTGATDNFEIMTTGYSAFALPNEEQMGMNSGNKLFTQTMSALSGTISTGSQQSSGAIYAATFRAGVEVYDSSGAKHQLVLTFRKVSTSNKDTEPTVWKWFADAPAPTTFEYPTFGEIHFNLDGSVQSYNPPAITVNPNTGSASGQVIRMDFGMGGAFNGLTSFAEVSAIRSGTGADGYAGGFLTDISTDQTGKLLGSFSNGKQFALGQVAIATFVNDEGLQAHGGNLYSQAPNSGPSTVGVAGTANRGLIAPSNLEMSNVDLSKALTNLIIIQRGYQASSKTITTSDQLLNTLLQLKQ
ncbi:flagellar hook protein FlgE [Campylobacterota bacterium]|nr:flagellar hook protein FlgE [Campylobacterota bacterium]